MSELQTPSPLMPGASGLSPKGGWFSDFQFHPGGLTVHKTGTKIALDATLIGECLNWFGYHLIVRARSWWLMATRAPGPAIWFVPDKPRPWYLIWAAMAWSGCRMARGPETADACFRFEDATWGLRAAPTHERAFNFGCLDVSKSHVAAVFEAVFGYPLAIDPETFVGPAVEKGELNGVHDGRVITCPHPRVPGKTYQKLVDTAVGPYIHDLRTPCVGGKPVVVWIKRKPAENRFSIHNLAVTRAAPEDIYSPEELELIARFAARMGLDWGGLDILRDQPSGRIYIVDVNKTDVGPVIALSLADKLRSTQALSLALRELLKGKTRKALR
ncbi:MAG: hypothetical protein V4597_00135 [Pseudomonadota bacterium]